MTHYNDKAADLMQLLLEVAENPSELRVIVKTDLPDLNQPWEDDEYVYYMIDKSDGGGQPILDENGKTQVDDNGNTMYEPAKIYDHWFVSDSLGNGAEFPQGRDVIRFFERVFKSTETEAYVETF